MFGYPWLLWAWQFQDDPDLRHDRSRGRPRVPRRFGRRRVKEQVQDQAQEQAGDQGGDQGAEPDDDLAPWPGLRLLLPLTEDDLITFGRELEDTQDVISRVLAEC